jgi:hypothetical protein
MNERERAKTKSLIFPSKISSFPKQLAVDSTTEKGDNGVLVFLNLDFSLVQHRSEALSTTLIESDCEFCPLAALVFSASHLPCLHRGTDFLFTLRTFGHETTFETICTYEDKRLFTWRPLDTYFTMVLESSKKLGARTISRGRPHENRLYLNLKVPKV